MSLGASLRHARRRIGQRVLDAAPTRRTIGRLMLSPGPPPPGEFAAYGTNSWIVPSSRVVNPRRIEIGANVVILEHATLCAIDGEGPAAPVLTIGSGVRLARFNSIVSSVGVVIGDRVGSSDSVAIFDTWDHAPTEGSARLARGAFEPAPVSIGDGAYLGCNSTICPGVTVGANAYVAEGAVVVDDVPPRTVVAGNPAVVVRCFDPGVRAWTDETTS